MRQRLFRSLIVFTFLIAMLPYSVFAAESVKLNTIPNLEPGKDVTISGTTTLTEVSIKVVRPNNTVLYVDVVTSSNGAFTKTFKMPSDAEVGTYSVVVGQGNVVDTKTFSVSKTTPTGNDYTGGSGSTTTPPPPTTTAPNTVVVSNDSVTVTKQTTTDGKTKVQVQVNKEKVIANLEKATNVDKLSIPVTKENANEVAEVVVPSEIFSALKSKNENAVVQIEAKEGTYRLPVQEINLTAIAAQLGTDKDISISIQVNETTDTAKVIEGNNLNNVSKIIDFTVQVSSGDKTITISKFQVYVEREIINDEPFNTKTSTAVRLNDDGTFTAIPTFFVGNRATFKSLGNSKYTVVENQKTFSDIQNHWAKSDVETMASKFIVNGMNQNQFAPNETLTRAQFTAFIVRALALDVEAGNSAFNDVKANDWFAGSVNAAVKAGIVTGYGDKSFKPNAPISREELAVLISRAINYTGNSVKSNTSNLAAFADQSQISDWAKKDVSILLETGITKGKTANTFAPKGQTTRAEATVMISRLMKHVKFIN